MFAVRSTHSVRTILVVGFFIAAGLYAPFGYSANYDISYSLPGTGRVSLNIYDANGRVVRELLHASQQSAGSHSITWDGKDRNGTDVPNSSTCTWKLLETPSGLHADYLLTAGASFPYGTPETGTNWVLKMAGVGNHTGPRCVTVDSSGNIYMGVGNSEYCANAIKMSSNGTWQWAGFEPDSWMGRYAFAVMNGTLYHMEQDQYVGGHGVNTPNSGYARVGYRPNCSANYVGFYWDFLWSGDTRGNGWDDNLVGPSYTYSRSDMAAYDCGGAIGEQLVISYNTHNAVRWFTPKPNGGVHSGVGPIPNSPLATVQDNTNLVGPRGVALESDGDVLVCVGTAIKKIDQSSHAISTVISGLSAPTLLDVDRSNGTIFVYDDGTRQVRKYNSSYTLQATYGTSGGRAWGLYVPTDFLGVTDICSDNSGGFFVTEGRNSGIRRLAHFNSSGGLVREWYAGGPWVPFACPEPDNPSIVWAETDRVNVSLDFPQAKEMAPLLSRFVLDFTSSPPSFTVHSTYKVDGLANGLVVARRQGAGIGAWQARKHNGVTYLCEQLGGGDHGGFCFNVLRVNSANWSLVPVVKAYFGGFQSVPGGGQPGFLWTDANGNGLEDAGERVTYSNWIISGVADLQVDNDFNYYYMSSGTRIVKIPVLSWNQVGGQDWAPVYKNLRDADGVTFATAPSDCSNAGMSPANPFSFGADGAVFANLNLGVISWGNVTDSRMVKWDANGTFQWEVGKVGANHNYYDYGHTVNTGEVWCEFRNGVGVANGCVIAADMNGGLPERDNWSAFEYCWDQDGLWVGNPFETGNCDTSDVAITRYCLSSENGAGVIYTDPTTGDVYYYGGQESETRVYKITGWNNWYRQAGNVTGVVDAPTFAPAPRTYSSAQSVAITTTTSGASIRYTADGSTPSDTVGTVYSTPVSISVNTTLKAIAYKGGMTNSSVTTGYYAIGGGGDETTNLYARWNFDSNATDTAPYGTANNGTLYGSPTYNTSDYKVGTASMSFVASSNQQVLVADQADLKPMDKITICLWMKPTSSVSDYANIVCKWDLGSSVPYRLRYDGSSLRFDLNVGGTDKNVKVSRPSVGAWTHVAATYDGNAMKIYKDGTEAGSLSVSGSISTTTSDLSIGARVDRAAGNSFDGLIDDVRIYSGYALTQTEIQQVMTVTGNTVAAPTFSPAAGTYDYAQSVTISSATSGASIRYTTDGTTPSSTAGTVYTAPVSIGTSCTLKAIACKTSMDNSSVTSGDYNIVDLPGDVNGDCVVNILDLIAIRNRQGQDPAIGENGKYDINGDGRINILDLILVRNRLNTQCPQ